MYINYRLIVKAKKHAFDENNALRELDALTNQAENGVKDGDDEEADEEKEGQGSEAEEEYEDEDDLVDDNDYGQNYFDNGEDEDVDDDDGTFQLLLMALPRHGVNVLISLLGDRGGDYY